MADFTTYTAALRARLIAEFTALPLYWPNDDRTPTLEAAPNGFVYSEIEVRDEEPASLGPNGQRSHRDYGEFRIYVYVPRGSLAGTAEGYAEQIRAAFKVPDVPDVVFTRRTIGAGQASENDVGRFWAVPVILQFYANRTE